MQQELLITFAVVWMGLSFGSIMLFQRGSDAGRKRKLWPVYTVFSNLVIAAFIIYMQPPMLMMLGLLAFMVPLTWLTVRATRFCDACGHASRAPFFMKPPVKCSHCHKPL